MQEAHCQSAAVPEVKGVVSAALAVWFFHRAKATPSPPMSLGIVDKPSDSHFRQCPICGPMVDERDLAGTSRPA